jgi:Cu(I)/Ag(I) efflux system membrane fusion protein
MKKKLNNAKICFLCMMILMLTIVSCSESKIKKQETMQMDMSKTYTCPMHPQIMRNMPGKCPICGMDLVEKISEKNAVPIDVKVDDLMKPVDEYVVSSIKTISPVEKEMALTIKANGFITYDTRLFSSVASRYEGRIEKLYVKYNFQKVEKGEKLFEVYSPELITAQQNLLFLIKNDVDNKTLIDGSKQKLSLLGMTKTQIDEMISSEQTLPTTTVYSPVSGYVIEEKIAMEMGNGMGGSTKTDFSTQELSVKEGQYLSKGQSVFKLVNTDKVWVLIKLLGSQIGTIKKGDVVQISGEAILNPVSEPIEFIQPVFEGADKYLTAHVHLHNPNGELKIGSLVKAEINAGVKKSLWINKQAVLDLGNEKVVLLKTNGALFKVKKITTGITVDDWIEVIDGISISDSIAENAQYLIDSESFVKQ